MSDDIATIQAEAVAVDAERDALTAPPVTEPPADGTPPSESVLSPIEEARALIDIAVGLAASWFPSLDGVYTEPARDRLARAAAPLLAKYGVSLSMIIARWKEEIDFAFVAMPLLLATARAVAADLDASKKAATKKSEPQPEPTAVA